MFRLPQSDCLSLFVHTSLLSSMSSSLETSGTGLLNHWQFYQNWGRSEHLYNLQFVKKQSIKMLMWFYGLYAASFLVRHSNRLKRCYHCEVDWQSAETRPRKSFAHNTQTTEQSQARFPGFPWCQAFMLKYAISWQFWTDRGNGNVFIVYLKSGQLDFVVTHNQTIYFTLCLRQSLSSVINWFCWQSYTAHTARDLHRTLKEQVLLA